MQKKYAIVFTKTFLKIFAGAAVGALLLSACAASAEAAPLTQAQVSAVASLLQAFGVDSSIVASVRQELQATPQSAVVLSAVPRAGRVPVDAALSASGLASGSYLLLFGDGTRSSAYQAIDGQFSTGHTYRTAGTYTISVEPYVACMWSNPRCLIATESLASTTVTVTQ